MRYFNVDPVWKTSPFLRLLPPFIAGLLTQWYAPLPSCTPWFLLFTGITGPLIFSLTSLSTQFRYTWVNGLFLHILLFATGVLLLNCKDIRRQTTGINTQYQPGHHVLATIAAPMAETSRSYKTVATVQALLYGDTIQPTRGKILLYFRKHSSVQQFQYGNQLIITKALQLVNNSGNPGSFNYQRYCLFQGMGYQVHLQPGDYIALKVKNENLFKKFLLSTNLYIVHVLQKYIRGEREAGLAEAMLIGYKEDLDKNLLQSYANTGVVHIIAISGLHLGLIYWLLLQLCKLPGKWRLNKFLQPVIIIAGLWLFSCMTGASPSVLRSAVMFTCLVIGQQLHRKTAVYNTLAASAFLLLCYNPFWLWDAGFQLSYAAVLSLAIFMQPIYNLLYFRHTIADAVWKATAVTLAAQVLTVPVAVYHFHQFPNLFLFANLLAVPLSGIILFLAILLCLVSMLPVLASAIGYVLHHLITWLNSYIEYINQLPFASSQGLQISLLQMICLYICIAGTGWWLLQKKKAGIYWTLAAALLFTANRTMAVVQAAQQKKLIVYNVPQHQAIDIMEGQQCFFTGDSLDQATQNFHLQPSRWLHRINETKQISVVDNLLFAGHHSILLIDKPMRWKQPAQKIPIDIIILSKNPGIRIPQLAATFTWRHLIIDNSNSLRKVNKWKQDCARLGLPCYCVADKGAFVFNGY
jgi:competence protein ComEC